MMWVHNMLFAAQRAAGAAADSAGAPGYGLWDRIVDFVDTPAPYSPYSEYLLLLFILWLMARRAPAREDFDRKAQDVLDAKYAKGELSKEAYEKYRQELTMRVKRGG